VPDDGPLLPGDGPLLPDDAPVRVGRRAAPAGRRVLRLPGHDGRATVVAGMAAVLPWGLHLL